jgi:hypothetical protein
MPEELQADVAWLSLTSRRRLLLRFAPRARAAPRRCAARAVGPAAVVCTR